MASLASESCSDCNIGAPKVGVEEQILLLKALPAWNVVMHDGIPQLERTFEFKSFVQALDFANAVGDLAEGAGHHPAILIEWGQTTVRWWTHKIKDLHRNDFVMAAKTDYLHGK